MALRRRDLLALGGVGLASAVAGGVAGAIYLQSKTGAGVLLSRPFRDLQGAERRLIEWRGKILVCNFWATWCAPCREEIPLLIAAQQQYAPKSVQMCGIGIDNADKIAEFAKSMKINYPVFIADGSAVDTMKELGNRQGALPYTVILDRGGALAEHRLGPFQKGELEQVLNRLLG